MGLEITYQVEKAYRLQSKTFTTNGVYTVDNGYEGLSEVTVDIPLQSVTITRNGTYVPDINHKAFSMVTVNVTGGDSTDDIWKHIVDKTISGRLYADDVGIIGNYAFYNCSKLTHVSFPNCTTIGICAFDNCRNISTATFPNCVLIEASAFNWCADLSSLYLTGSSVATLVHSNAFRDTLIGERSFHTTGTQLGSIYVPSSLFSQYISAPNWSYFYSQFVSI